MNDLLIQVLFYVFAAIAIASAVLVITQNNPVRCVLFLVVTFFASSVLWILVEAEFLALILVLVYVGAVMTLFLFVVMMLNIDIESIRTHLIRYLPFGLVIVALIVGLLMVALPKDAFKPNPNVIDAASTANSQLLDASSQAASSSISNTEAIGMTLYTDYVLAFEVAAVLLLVAIISTITLVHRGAIRSKRQDIKQQILTSKADRLEIIRMQSEK